MAPAPEDSSGNQSQPAEPHSTSQAGTDFKEAAPASNPGLLRELLHFIIEYKAWWLAPLIGALLLLTGIALLSGTGAAPFIYTLF